MRYLLLQKLIYSLPHDGNSKTCKYTLLFSHSHLFENFSCHNALMFFFFLSTLFLFFLRLCIINREHTVREKSLRFLVSLLVQNYIMWCHPFELAIKPNIRKLKINYRTKLSVFVLLFYSWPDWRECYFLITVDMRMQVVKSSWSLKQCLQTFDIL